MTKAKKVVVKKAAPKKAAKAVAKAPVKKVAKPKKKVDLFVGGLKIISREDVVINGIDRIKVALINGTTTIVTEDEIKS